MITSPTPWSFKLYKCNNPDCDKTHTVVNDFAGNKVAVFVNINDAEKICSLFEQLNDLENKVEELQTTINDLEYAAEEDRRERDTLT